MEQKIKIQLKKMLAYNGFEKKQNCKQEQEKHCTDHKIKRNLTEFRL